MIDYACPLLAVSTCMILLSAASGEVLDLGVPVRKAGHMGTVIGPNSDDTKDLVYFNFMQTKGKLFLLSVDPDTGETHQYDSPCEQGAWASILGPDRKLYLGTVGRGLVLRFDPQQPNKGIQVVGRPSQTETYIWQFAIGKDGKVYGCTYGNAKLVSYDPQTDTLEDLGRMDETQQYTRTIAVGPSGKVYLGIGSARQNLVVYDPTRREHRSICLPEWRESGFLSVMPGGDGKVYARVLLPPNEEGKRVWQPFRIENEELIPVKRVPGRTMRLRDGRYVSGVTMTKDGGHFTVSDPRSKSKRSIEFRYRGSGCGIFMVAPGPKGHIYGSTVMPLEVFRCNPRSDASEHLGNMPGGEVYSMLEYRGKQYLCYYGGSIMNLYDPENPQWKWGYKPDCNPRSYGGVGDGHLRPRAMIRGPNDMIYVGSYPAYGQLGGAMAVWDPDRNKTIENYRHLVRDQSIVALAYDPTTGLIFGGSGNRGGGGTHPTQKEAVFFAFDPDKKCKLFETPLVPGAQTYQALCAVDGKIFVAVDEKLLVYDAAQRKVVHQTALPSKQVEISLGRHRDGLIYGLTHSAIYSIDPNTYARSVLTKPTARIDCGFALTDTGIYFGSGTHLYRYAWLGDQTAP